MFHSKTLFVVGAGASREANLPTGDELTAIIAKKIDIQFLPHKERFSGDDEIRTALRFHAQGADGPAGDINPYLHACWHIRDAMPQAISIDSFIDHQGDAKIELCGKLAIVRSILEAEKNSLLFIDERQAEAALNFNFLKDTWYTSFMQILTDGVHKKNINQFFENVSFIIFNYDRCIEHFIFQALQNYYRAQATEAADIMQKLKIIHPYGMVGRLPWQGDGGDTPFGTNVGGKRLLSLAEQIKTFTERVDDQAKIAEIHQVVQEAEVIVFLGFAFHDQNIQLMKSDKIHRMKCIFATAKGISDDDREVITQQIKNSFLANRASIPIHLRHDLTCNNIFREYRRTLSR